MVKELYRDLQDLNPPGAYRALAESGWRIYERKNGFSRDYRGFSRLCEKDGKKVVFTYYDDRLQDVSEVYAPEMNTYGKPN